MGGRGRNREGGDGGTGARSELNKTNHNELFEGNSGGKRASQSKLERARKQRKEVAIVKEYE